MLDIVEGAIINETSRVVTLIRISDDDGEKQTFIFWSFGIVRVKWSCREGPTGVEHKFRYVMEFYHSLLNN